MKLVLSVCVLLIMLPSLAKADSVTLAFSFSGAVEEFLSQGNFPAPWNVTGLPHNHGDLVTGSFSYTTGQPGSSATMTFTIDGVTYTTSNLTATTFHEPTAGSAIKISGMVDGYNAEVALIFIGPYSMLCSSLSTPCTPSIPDIRDLSNRIAGGSGGTPLAPMVNVLLQIRDPGSFFWSYQDSTNQGQSIFLNAPITTFTALPAPSSLLTLGVGFFALALFRRFIA